MAKEKMNLKIISAGAGSGKTFRLMTEMVSLLQSGTVQPEGIIATTFTKKAAAELEERVRIRLLEEGMSELADRLTGALIGTVHSLGVKLLKRFSFEAGISPGVDIIADEDQSIFFNQSLATILTQERVERMEQLTHKMALRKQGQFGSPYDWRHDLRDIVDRARANGFDVEKLKASKQKSYETLCTLFPEPSKRSAAYFSTKLSTLLNSTLSAIEENEVDTTKATRSAKDIIQKFIHQREKGDALIWYDWVSLSKMKPGAKSRELVEELVEFTRSHDEHPDFLVDIKAFIDNMFDIACMAIAEYENFKQKRGLIDYIDMETHVKRLLDHPEVSAVLSEEVQLLMVDEFQDTSPIQLEIFYKLSQMANHSVWVGDPKQSIYGFRGAEPELMQAIIQQNGGIRSEDIQRYSWRSREEVVYTTNSLFCKSFSDLPVEQVALIPKRRAVANPPSTSNKTNEPIEMGSSLIHWHYEHEGGKKTPPGRPWMERCIAQSIRHFVERKVYVNDKETGEYRPVRPGDIAILCHSNSLCLTMAEALHHQGLNAAIARNGLLETPEVKLVLSCLKYLLNPYDSLSVAEITFLASFKPLEEIIDSRIQWMEEKAKEDSKHARWEAKNPYIERLDELRGEITELSGAEILNLILADLDLRRIIISWGQPEQRCDNVDMLRKFADKYEETCNRLHTGASLGGFLLWLNDLAANDSDAQGFSEQPDAVNVLTYHRSKGLEWPVVIMHSLEKKTRDSLWGANVVAESDEVDLDNLSANRYIRFWRHPYGRQFQKTNLEVKVESSPEKKVAKKKALQEEARVLYVGITRARDYLVFPTRKKHTLWLNRCWHGIEGENQMTLDPNSMESPWEWEGEVLPIATEVELMPRLLEHHPRPEKVIIGQEERAGKIHDTNRFYIDTERDDFSSEYRFSAKNKSIFGADFKEIDEVSPYIISKAMQSFLSFDLPEHQNAARLAAARRITQRYGISEEVPFREMAHHAHQFTAWVSEHFTPTKWLKHYPILLKKGDQQFSTSVDLVLDTPSGIIAIQHSSFSGHPSKWRTKASEHINWFYLTRLGLQEAFPDRNVAMLMHFVLRNGVLELAFFD